MDRPLSHLFGPLSPAGKFNHLQTNSLHKETGNFSNVLQERFFDKQGNYRSTAHVDESAGIDLAGGQDNRHDVPFDVIQRDHGDAG
jgi:hypothetical protein